MPDKKTIIQHLLHSVIGENPDRGGLLETPDRVAKAWEHWAGGYLINPADVLKTFEDGAENYDQIILVKDIPLYSHCEHHLAPFFGKAHVAYIPDGRIVGLSKLSRVVDIYARRLQVQERLTSQVAEAIQNALAPKAVGVVVECRHMCMESRGIRQQGSTTVTSAMKGLFEWDRSAKEELMRLIKG
jgi:GTP cyclohydrolase I